MRGVTLLQTLCYERETIIRAPCTCTCICPGRWHSPCCLLESSLGMVCPILGGGHARRLAATLLLSRVGLVRQVCTIVRTGVWWRLQRGTQRDCVLRALRRGGAPGVLWRAQHPRRYTCCSHLCSAPGVIEIMYHSTLEL